MFVIPGDCRDIMKIINRAGEARIVGGWIRDNIVKPIHYDDKRVDIDIATNLLPNEVAKILEREGIPVKPIGLSHGTVMAVLNRAGYEITTLRKDVKCHGRRADVEFVDSWEEDASRRDFTINAMMMDINHNLYDYHGGCNDLLNRRVRFIGAQEDRIQEDYLRILRWFRFVLRIDADFDSSTLEIMKDFAHNLRDISVERVWSEMRRMLAMTNGSTAISLMIRNSILPDMFLFQGDMEDVANDIASLAFSTDYIVNFAACLSILEASEESVVGICKKFKLPKREREDLLMLMRCNIDTNGDDMFYKRKAVEYPKYYQRALLKMNVMNEISMQEMHSLAYFESFRDQEMPISGDDIVELVDELRYVGKVLKYCKNAWIDSNFSINKKTLLRKAKLYASTLQ